MPRVVYFFGSDATKVQNIISKNKLLLEKLSPAANMGFAKERVKFKLQLFYFLSAKTIFYLLKKSKLANKKMVLLTVVLN